MLKRLKDSSLMFWSLELLILTALVFLATKINFLFAPIGTFFSTLFAPVLIAGFLYYLLNPLVNLLMKSGMKRLFAIIIVFLVLIASLIFLLMTFIPNLVQQLTALARNIPQIIQETENWLVGLSEKSNNLPLFKEFKIEQYFNSLDISTGELVQKFLRSASNSLSSIVSTVTSTVVVIITAPFILFYMLKDGYKLVPNVKRLFPSKEQKSIVELLGQLNKTLADYISGQAIECLFVGTCTFIGYFLIDVNYAFLFGVIAGLTNLIPYLGPYLGLAPAVLVTIFDSPFKALLCCLVVLIVQQLDGNIIYPNVIGKSLNIHPLTIILILLVAGNLSGILGVLLGVPVYAILRTIVIFIVNLLQESHRREKNREILK